jgi:aryl-alcohol dehydrogenase-like predicted oxidoreductase
MSNRGDVFIGTKSPHRLGVRNGWKTVTKRLLRQLDDSLKALRTDYIDFYFLHAISPNIYDRTVVTLAPVLLKLKEQGQIRFIGISEDVPYDPGHLVARKAMDSKLFDVIMRADTGLVFGNKPIFGMLVNGPVTPAHLKRFQVTLTGTSNVGHLLSNIDACQ